MNAREILSERKQAILERWFDRIAEDYPAQTSRFLKAEADPFANPVGGAVRAGIEGFFDHLVQGGDDARAVLPLLDRIVRVRAVQDLSPARATAFVFLLKDVVREELRDALGRKEIVEELLELESRIDGLALLAFDVYVQCREKVWQLKAAEVRNGTLRLLQQAGRDEAGRRQAPEPS